MEYLNDKWTFKELEAFVKRTEVVIDHIYKNPLLYPYLKESDTLKFVVAKQVRLFCLIFDYPYKKRIVKRVYNYNYKHINGYNLTMCMILKVVDPF